MPRSRKNRITVASLSSVLKMGLISLLIGSAGLAYVWQKNQIYLLAQEKKRGETRLEELRRLNKARSDHFAYLRLPWVLESRVKELNLGLVIPQPEQILRIVEMPGSSVNNNNSERVLANRQHLMGTIP
jgi:hypothetical protein